MKTDDQLVAAVRFYLATIDSPSLGTPRNIAAALHQLREAVAGLIEPEAIPPCDDLTFLAVMHRYARGEGAPLATTRGDMQRLLAIASRAALVLLLALTACQRPDPETARALDGLERAYREECLRVDTTTAMRRACTSVRNTLDRYGRQ